jgi:hypothetical protein
MSQARMRGACEVRVETGVEEAQVVMSAVLPVDEGPRRRNVGSVVAELPGRKNAK